MKRIYPERIEDIKEQINNITLATSNVTKEDFFNNYILQAAIIRWLEIIGEAAKYIPENIKTTYPEIPWKQMAGMRDIVAHDYDNIEYDQVWNTIQEDIPILKIQIDKIILS